MSRTRSAPVTVVIPAYRAAPYLADAIRSVQAQTLPVAEIVVVDDGSPDASAEIARSLGATVIRQENRGAPAARNAAIRASRQEWVAFLDHDDVWEEDKIEWQWRARELRPEVGVISCDFREFGAAGGGALGPSVYGLPDTGIDRMEMERPAEGIGYLPKVRGEFFTTVRKNVFFPSTLMARRDLALAVGLFDERLFPVDDVDFFLRLAARSPLAVIARPLMRYRVHESNASRNELTMYLSFFELVRRMTEHPERYPQGAVAAFTASLADKYAAAARLLLDAGERSEARRLLEASLHLRRAPRTAALWLATLVTPSLLRSVVEVKRSLVGGTAAPRARDAHVRRS